MNPLDAMAYGLANKLKSNYKITRILMDLTMFLIGWYLGGVAGLRTIFAVTTTGPLVSLYVKNIEQRTQK